MAHAMRRSRRGQRESENGVRESGIRRSSKDTKATGLCLSLSPSLPPLVPLPPFCRLPASLLVIPSAPVSRLCVVCKSYTPHYRIKTKLRG
eukprot:scaffold41334_cov19-Tisochrysis_lutea.AAC.1